MPSLAFLCLDGLHAPIHLGFYVGALKAVFLSSFSGITTSIPQESAACAFITRDQRLSSSRRLTQQPYSAQRGSFAASVWGHVNPSFSQLKYRVADKTKNCRLGHALKATIA